ncbi:unnamed protein product [Rhizophagus irregularis]|uniref:Uncharacterized protein n=1 Tax=Rhizophagus irregularis TaxID=588596 RepID=A0A915ZMQ3_9GLOM|nr:unnamed protein product [Rhizophagus irregularis]
MQQIFFLEINTSPTDNDVDPGSITYKIHIRASFSDYGNNGPPLSKMKNISTTLFQIHVSSFQVDSNRKWAKELRKKEKLNKAPVPQTPPKPKVILPEVTTLLLIQHHLSTAAQRNSRSSRTFFLTVLSLAVQEKLYIKHLSRRHEISQITTTHTVTQLPLPINKRLREDKCKVPDKPLLPH